MFNCENNPQICENSKNLNIYPNFLPRVSILNFLIEHLMISVDQMQFEKYQINLRTSIPLLNFKKIWNLIKISFTVENIITNWPEIC